MEDLNEAASIPLQQGDSATKELLRQRKNKVMAQATAENGQVTATNNAGNGGKPPKERKIGLLPTPSEGKEVVYKGKVIAETTWHQLGARKVFSVNPGGEHPYFKISKSSYCDLVTGEIATGVPVTDQRKVYRVSLT